MMTFKEARKNLEKIADGKYYVLSFELVTFANNYKKEIECKLYIDGYEFFTGETWEKAFESLEKITNPPTIKEEEIEKMTEGIDEYNNKEVSE